MSTTYENLTGELYWGRIHPDNPDEYRGNKNWVVNLVLNDKELEKFKSFGLMNQVRDYQGRPSVRFKRPVEKTFNGEVTKFDPPKVLCWVDGEDKPVEFPDLNMDEKFAMGIGNGSKISVSLTIYSTANGSGARFNDIVVLDHVPYVPEEKTAGERKTNTVEQKEAEGKEIKPW